MSEAAELGRAYTYLSKAVRKMCTNTDNLRTRWMKVTESHLGGTWVKHFPEGELRPAFEELEPSFGKEPESEEAAETLIKKLLHLHDDTEMELHQRNTL